MDTNNITELARSATDLEIRSIGVHTGVKQSRQATIAALECSRYERARGWLELSLAWDRLRKFVQDWRESLQKARLTYVVDAWFLCDLIRRLTLGKDEEIVYVTGVALGRIKILSRICDVTLEQQSVVYARATAKSCTETLAQILDMGNTLHVMAHSHPGYGAAATHESSIDINYLGKIQRAGAEVVGIIVTRDGFVRFFTVEKSFQVLVQGNGVTQIEKNVFQITSF